MNTLFSSSQSLLPKLIICIILSTALILVDHRTSQMQQVRVYLNSAISPLQWLANTPGAVLDWTSQRFVSHRHLVAENERLQQDSVLIAAAMQRYQLLREENTQLRALLGATERQGDKRMIAELMAVDNNPFNHQVVINRGTNDGVYEGQPVLDQHGIVGQVQHVAVNSSRVLLLADVSHHIPVRVLRNNLNAVLTGKGTIDELSMTYMAHSADIRVGDLLVSSGLGKRFPEGYPVARVTLVDNNKATAFANIDAQPVARLNQLKYLVLLWPQGR